jgi:hypothetical protein
MSFPGTKLIYIQYIEISRQAKRRDGFAYMYRYTNEHMRSILSKSSKTH